MGEYRFIVDESFASFSEFDCRLKTYMDESKTSFVIVNSKTVTAFNNSTPEHSLPLSLKYKNATYGCKHSGIMRSSRPSVRTRKLQSYKKNCPAMIKISVDMKSERLVVRCVIEAHNHDNEDIEMLYPLCELQVKQDIHQEITRLSAGQYATPNDLINMRAKLSKWKSVDDAEDLVKELGVMLKDDPLATIVFGEHDGNINQIFLQTSAMRKLMNRFPEVLLIDTTNMINKHGVPLVIFMVMDGHGNGRFVAYCFVHCETKEIVHAALKLFKSSNNETCLKIRTVVVDRDCSEISEVQEDLPNTHVQLSMFHVLKTLQIECMKEPDETRDKVHTILTSLGNSMSEDNHTKLLADLQQTASTSFNTHFKENWCNCNEAWAKYQREESSNPRNTTIKGVESHKREIASIVNEKQSLSEVIQGLLLHQRNKTNSPYFDSYSMSLAKVPPIVNKEDLRIADILSCYTPFAANITINQLTQSRSLKNVQMLPNGLQVSASNGLFKTSFDTCSCSHFLSMFLPCKHIFYKRHLNKLLPFEKKALPQRWSNSYNEKIKTRQLPKQESTRLSSRDHVNECMRNLLEASGLLSNKCDEKVFEERLALLHDLNIAWSKNLRVRIVPCNEHNDQINVAKKNTIEPVISVPAQMAKFDSINQTTFDWAFNTVIDDECTDLVETNKSRQIIKDDFISVPHRKTIQPTHTSIGTKRKREGMEIIITKYFCTGVILI